MHFMNKLQIEIALQDGAIAEVKGDRIIITINTEITKRDLWDSQMEFWLTKKDDIKTLSSGFLRVVKNKLVFKKWK